MAEFRPGKPRQQRKLTSSQAAASVPHLILWDSIDSDGTWGAADDSGTIAIGLAGLFIVTFAMGHTAGTGAQVVNAELRLNGTPVRQQQSASASGVIGCCGSFQRELAVNDTLELFLVGNALTGGKSIDAGLTSMEISRIGPVRWT